MHLEYTVHAQDCTLVMHTQHAETIQYPAVRSRSTFLKGQQGRANVRHCWMKLDRCASKLIIPHACFHVLHVHTQAYIADNIRL